LVREERKQKHREVIELKQERETERQSVHEYNFPPRNRQREKERRRRGTKESPYLFPFRKLRRSVIATQRLASDDALFRSNDSHTSYLIYGKK
jgi:hypothetical protein